MQGCLRDALELGVLGKILPFSLYRLLERLARFIFMVIREDLEQIGFGFRVAILNDSLGYIKSRANVLLILIDLLIERLSEQNCGFVEHKSALFDTDDVQGSV